MSKVSKSIKDANPDIYGYASPEEITGNWVPYVDADGDLRFVPCSYEFFKWYDNERRKEKLNKSRESRCLINSDRYKGLVRCMEDCEHCPFGRDHREGNPLSLDLMIEEGYEPADTSYTEPEEDIRMEEVWKYISTLNETDQTILTLFNEGKTDEAIAEVVSLTRENVKKKRQRLIKKLKNKFE